MTKEKMKQKDIIKSRDEKDVKDLKQKLADIDPAGFHSVLVPDSTKANETAAAFMSDKDAIRDRELFVRNLGELLSQTRDGVVGCELIDAEKPTEHVLVTYRGGGTRRICVHMDSYAAIIRDVAKGFQ